MNNGLGVNRSDGVASSADKEFESLIARARSIYRDLLDHNRSWVMSSDTAIYKFNEMNLFLKEAGLGIEILDPESSVETIQKNLHESMNVIHIASAQSCFDRLQRNEFFLTYGEKEIEGLVSSINSSLARAGVDEAAIDPSGISSAAFIRQNIEENKKYSFLLIAQGRLERFEAYDKPLTNVRDIGDRVDKEYASIARVLDKSGFGWASLDRSGLATDEDILTRIESAVKKAFRICAVEEFNKFSNSLSVEAAESSIYESALRIKKVFNLSASDPSVLYKEDELGKPSLDQLLDRAIARNVFIRKKSIERNSMKGRTI